MILCDCVQSVDSSALERWPGLGRPDTYQTEHTEEAGGVCVDGHVDS